VFNYFLENQIFLLFLLKMPKATGALGIWTQADGKVARAVLSVMEDLFEKEKEAQNDEFSIEMHFKLRSILPVSALPGESLRLCYTDNTRYLQINTKRQHRDFLKATFNEIFRKYKMLLANPGVESNVVLTELTTTPLALRILVALPIPATSTYWDLVHMKITKQVGTGADATTPSTTTGTGAPLPKAKAKKEEPVVPKDENHAAIMSEFAEQAFGALDLWPEAREDLMRVLVKHGAQVKKETDAMSGDSTWVKKEQAEWIYIGDVEDEATQVPGTSSGSGHA
jgi:hypothetical protein